ncbi:MAG: MarR family transcriptional regulator [Oricola sp.]
MSFNLETFLAYRLDRISEAVSRHFQPVYRDQHGMTRPEWKVLAHLGEAETLTAREIVRRTGLHKTKVSRAVSALEKRRWLDRTRDEADRRIEHLALTARGRTEYDKLVGLLMARERELLHRLDGDKMRTIAEALSILEGMTGSKSQDKPEAGRQERADHRQV